MGDCDRLAGNGQETAEDITLLPLRAQSPWASRSLALSEVKSTPRTPPKKIMQTECSKKQFGALSAHLTSYATTVGLLRPPTCLLKIRGVEETERPQTHSPGWGFPINRAPRLQRVSREQFAERAGGGRRAQ
ncbi:hypothetical protein SKAU_G00139570 [Synaphobranchus kaupii]|uniref:Uncharacterized protein n=1 Tax=Synaphobranchus kaupii TaxID=118154 RepID=A0A9Q1FS02_SYNKA|nr:hypothetical protein SKAU_G00139570 [Synaphobranchus kaupii]